MGKTRVLFKKIRDAKRTFHANMGSIKDRNGENQLLREKKYKFWTEPRPCMVLGLKPMGKPTT